MAKLKTLMNLFEVGTPNPATNVGQLLEVVQKNNDFKASDLEKDVIEVRSVLGYKNHPKAGNFSVQMARRTDEGGLPGYPGFSFHSKHFVSYDDRNDILYLFECNVRILTKDTIPKKDIRASQITNAYISSTASARMVTYTSDHSV